MWIEFFDGKTVNSLKNVQEINVDLKERKVLYGFKDDEPWKVREIENPEWINIFSKNEDEEDEQK